jgi:hypothetical protein
MRVGQKNKITRRWPSAARAERSQRPASRLRLYLWHDLPQGGRGRSPRYAEMQHRSHEPTPGRNRHPGRARCAAQNCQPGELCAWPGLGLLRGPVADWRFIASVPVSHTFAQRSSYRLAP